MMRAIDFEMDARQAEDLHGNRVAVTYDGNCLLSGKW